MGFMEIQVERADWYEVETAAGETEIVPADLEPLGNAPETFDAADGGAPAGLRLLQALTMYVDGTPRAYTLRRNAWGGRLSAPGYMDCTPWSLYESEEEARKELSDMYGEDD